ncbi:3665_t:CDS:2, partial [Racocetra persica]
ISQNLHKEAATQASRCVSSSARPPLAFNFTGDIPLSSRHNTDKEDMRSETSANIIDLWTSAGSKNAEDGILKEINWKDEKYNTSIAFSKLVFFITPTAALAIKIKKITICSMNAVSCSLAFSGKASIKDITAEIKRFITS